METWKEFAHLTERAREETVYQERVKTSVNLPIQDVYMIDRLAKAIDLSRQEVITRIIHSGLPDAFRGYFKIMGDDPLEAMSWEDFCEKVDQGEYFSQ